MKELENPISFLKHVLFLAGTIGNFLHCQDTRSVVINETYNASYLHTVMIVIY